MSIIVSIFLLHYKRKPKAEPKQPKPQTVLEYDSEGYNRQGYNAVGRNRQGKYNRYYPNIIDNSGYIRVCIDVDHNDDEKLILFRNWNDFDYCVDKSTCTNLPDGLLNATLNIKDKASGEIVWTFLI